VSHTAEQFSLLRRRTLRLLRTGVFRMIVGVNLVAAVVILIRGLGWLQPLELTIYDQLRAAWAGHKASPRVVLVGATESDIGRWGWPLNDGVLADLLERLASQRPRVIAIDIYRDRAVPPGSETLAAVLARHPEIIWAFKMPKAADPGVPPPQVLVGTDRSVISDTPVDPGNVVRRALLYADDGKNVFLTVGTAIAQRYLRVEGASIRPTTDGRLQFGKALIAPLDDTSGPYIELDSRGYQVLLDYKGGLDQFTQVSLGEVMDSEDTLARVRDRAVVVGVAAESVKDDVITPFSTGFGAAPPIRGMVMHALLADQLVREAAYGASILTGPSRPIENLWIWAWALTGGLLGVWFRHTIRALAGVATGLAVLGGTVYAAFGAALLLPALPAAIAWVGAAGLSNRVLHAASNRDRARLRRTFEHYLPPVVIANMIDSQSLPRLGGERREISVVFTDIANFTTLSETKEPEVVAALLNEYFAGACGAIFAEGGLVYEFIGDAVLAFFGAPQEQPDHADRAVSAALALDAFAYEFSSVQRARGVEFGITRVGVHTGIALVGNIGTPSRLKYTALGDMLNTGSRLEGLNKAIGTRICVSGETVRQSRRHKFRPIGDFVVKGRHNSVAVFEPLAARDSECERVARYETALRALQEGQCDAASQFIALHRDFPDDPCIAFHCHRLAEGENGTLIVMAEK
jgi:adenylate cyclase